VDRIGTLPQWGDLGAYAALIAPGEQTAHLAPEFTRRTLSKRDAERRGATPASP